jgi:hypothetical protein
MPAELRCNPASKIGNSPAARFLAGVMHRGDEIRINGAGPSQDKSFYKRLAPNAARAGL